jgi:hypothetical protein
MTDEAKLRGLVTEFKRRCVHNANVFKKNYDYYYDGKSDAYEKAADMLEELLNEKPCSLCEQEGTHLCEPFRQPVKDESGIITGT